MARTAGASSPSLPDADDGGGSQTMRAQLRLRELIVGGEIEPGTRIAELMLVERLGVSRTPVRAALVRLAEEGLLEALPGGGFAARHFSETDIQDAIELRGTLEGLAARLAAERGVGTVLMAQWRDCVGRMDELLAPPSLSASAFEAYVDHNSRYHQFLAQAAGSALVRRQIERVVTLPFASPSGFVMLRATGAHARDTLVIAQQQHRAALEAIGQREGTRAEAVLREHARLAHANLREALQSHQGWEQVPGARLIRPAAR